MYIYTIGHSNHPRETFLALLKEHRVQVLVDVRSNPVSRWAPFANKAALPRLLDREGIGYRYMGDALGGKPAEASLYDSKGKPDYGRMRALASFQEGIDTLLALAEHATVAIMCAEEDPAKCHRNLLIGPALEGYGVGLVHIRKDPDMSGQGSEGSASRSQGQGGLAL